MLNLTKKTLVSITLLPLSVGVFAGCSQSDNGQSTSSPSATSSQGIDIAQAVPGSTNGSAGTSSSSAPNAAVASASAGGKNLKMDSLDAGAAQVAAVQNYLNIRENRESTKYKTVGDWENAMHSAINGGGDAVIQRYWPGDSSGQRRIANANGYTVNVIVGDCKLQPAYTTTDGNTVAVQCVLHETTQANGKDIAGTNVDTGWHYYGLVNPAPTIALTKSGDGWQVANDYSGLAS